MKLRDFIDLVETFNWDETTLLFELFDVEKFLSRAKSVQSLIIRGATEGERDAARMAMKRLITRAIEDVKELTPIERQQFIRRFDAIRTETTSKAEPASARKPSANPYRDTSYRPKSDQAEKDAEYARNQERNRRNQERADAEDREWQQNRARNRAYSNANDTQRERDLADILAYAEFREGTSDKVYGIIKRDGGYYTFWGRNGASLATKKQDSHNVANIVFYSKIRKGYVEKPITPYVKQVIMRNLRF